MKKRIANDNLQVLFTYKWKKVGIKVTSHLRGVLREKIRTCAIFNKILTNYISEERLKWSLR